MRAPTGPGRMKLGASRSGPAPPERQVLIIPDLAARPPNEQAMLAQADELLAPMRPPSAEAVLAAGEHRFGTLRHRLSAEYRCFNPRKRELLRSPLEKPILARHYDAILGAAPFTATLCQMATEATGCETSVRTGSHWLGADRFGHRVRLPSPAELEERLEGVGATIRIRAAGAPVFTAIVTLAGLVNAHPFADGNGRVARMLFTACLRAGGLPHDTYIPFYEFAERACGGYEIALRLAEIRGEWSALVAWATKLIRLCAHWPN